MLYGNINTCVTIEFGKEDVVGAFIIFNDCIKCVAITDMDASTRNRNRLAASCEISGELRKNC